MFNVGDRVIHPRFGAGVVIAKAKSLNIPYIVVFDNRHIALYNWEDSNLPPKRCGRFYGESLEKEVNNNV